MKASVAIALAMVAGGGSGEAVPVLYISSDAWIRTGPSISHERYTGLPRGTAVIEVSEPKLAFEPRSDRWVHVWVLEGRAAGREGWVWGEFVACCKHYEWLSSDIGYRW